MSPSNPYKPFVWFFFSFAGLLWQGPLMVLDGRGCDSHSGFVTELEENIERLLEGNDWILKSVT